MKGANHMYERWKTCFQSYPRLRQTLLFSLVAIFSVSVPLACGTGGGIGEPQVEVVGGNAELGQDQIESYGCGSCHTIPGIDSAEGTVGPPLSFWADRAYIAGNLPNNPDNLVRWIQNPQEVEPGTAMPVLGVTEAEARDIAAYLYTLSKD